LLLKGDDFGWGRLKDDPNPINGAYYSKTQLRLGNCAMTSDVGAGSS
jgi:hypothetical protein